MEKFVVKIFQPVQYVQYYTTYIFNNVENASIDVRVHSIFFTSR